ncbi:MAG: methylated-DNA--[protein]-cysteine S-methyltransferase [Sphaerochaetaceae bacterium]|nr:methylated-DNA--[protein]-cysteine S-methyltransferase [Sphaerochaetaceae bacterium]
MTYICHCQSPIGPITLASDGEYLTNLWFDKQRFDRAGLGEFVEANLPVFEETCKWLTVYFTGRDPGFLPPMKLSGSPFRQMVGQIMLTIPFGCLMTYGQIAKEVARRTGKQKVSAQAVGGAVGHNPIGIIVPCHRVVGTSGSLTGYGGGMDRKVFLLENEHVDFAEHGLFVPTKGSAL